MRLVVTRPEPDATTMRRALEAAGHAVIVEPLLHLEPVAGPPIALDGVQALVATSRNALRAVGGRLDMTAAAGLPLVAVGAGTAALAKETGFQEVIEGPAAGGELPDLISPRFDPGAGALLHLAGEPLAHDLATSMRARGYEVRVAVVYRSVPAAQFSAATRSTLASGGVDGVILMSPATANTYARLVRLHGLEQAASRLVHVCISANVAGCLAPLGAPPIEVALRPNAQEVLALVARVAAKLNPKVNSP